MKLLRISIKHFTNYSKFYPVVLWQVFNKQAINAIDPFNILYQSYKFDANFLTLKLIKTFIRMSTQVIKYFKISEVLSNYTTRNLIRNFIQIGKLPDLQNTFSLGILTISIVNVLSINKDNNPFQRFRITSYLKFHNLSKILTNLQIQCCNKITLLVKL